MVVYTMLCGFVMNMVGEKYKIPKSFTIHGHTIKVEIVNELSGEKFGEYDCVLEVIKIASNIRRETELIPLSVTQIYTTFLHELFHAMQFHSGREFSEEEAQIYSGLLFEYLNTINYEF